jgi:hypothetical protein
VKGLPCTVSATLPPGGPLIFVHSAEDAFGVSAHTSTQKILLNRTRPHPEGVQASNYSIYIIFPRNPGKDEGRMRVYAGRVVSEDEATERASAILDEPGGGAEAVEVIGWGRPENTVIHRPDQYAGKLHRRP